METVAPDDDDDDDEDMRLPMTIFLGAKSHHDDGRLLGDPLIQVVDIWVCRCLGYPLGKPKENHPSLGSPKKTYHILEFGDVNCHG